MNVSINPSGVRKDRHLASHHTPWPPMTEPFDGWRELDAYDFGEQPTRIPSDETPELSGELDWNEEDIDRALDILDAA